MARSRSGARAVALFIALGSACGIARAQSFNIDFGLDAAPSSTYGAASGSAGVWNQIDTLGPTSGLIDTAGVVTSSALDLEDAGFFPSSPQPPATDLQALAGDSFSAVVGQAWFVSVTGLKPGAYDLYFYSSTSSLNTTGNFLINGRRVVKDFGPANPNEMSPLRNYRVVQSFEIGSSGTLRVRGEYILSSPIVYGLAGLQIVEAGPPLAAVPEPGAALLLGPGLLLVGMAVRAKARQRLG